MDVRGSKWLWSLVACVAASCLGGCAFTGKGKGTSIKLKVFKEEHHLVVPREPLRRGTVELRLTEAFVEERKTVLEHAGWVTFLRGVVVSSQRLERTSLGGRTFTVIGASGKVYDGYAFAEGRQWEREGGEQYLAPHASGELKIMAETQSPAGELDDPVAFTFGDVRVELSH